jgi:hypothetical protein
MARISLIAFSWISTLSLIRWTACTCAQFSGCSSTTVDHSKTGQMAVCCQNLMLGALSSHSALSVPVGALFKKFGLFFLTHVIYRVSQKECARLRESVPYVKLYRYNPKHLCPKLNCYRDNGQRNVWASGVSMYCTPSVTSYLSNAPATRHGNAVILASVDQLRPA